MILTKRVLMAKKDRIATDSSEGFLSDNPFGSLDLNGLPEASAPVPAQPKIEAKASPQKKRGRVDIIREKAGRGGKTVTVVKGLDHIEVREREQLLKQLKNYCATGGALKGATLEIQGDQREKVAAFFENAGFRPVFAGG